MTAIIRSAVIIPFYKSKLTHNELVSLQQCLKVLSNYPIIAVKPQSLTLPADISTYPFFDVISFDDACFASIQGYNRLMLSAEFYGAFLNYDYILIHQLDAFVFSDELDKWCAKDIDYVGPPWIRPRAHDSIFEYLEVKLQYFWYRYLDKKTMGIAGLNQLENLVGNGGFSLRRVKRFYDLCSQMSPQIDLYNSNPAHQFNEDVFWSVEVDRAGHQFNIPGYREALKFAFEIAPERARLLNNGQLPFGCHAWDINIDYWRPIFKQYGYEV